MAILGFPSTSIIDSTSAGRALLTAANAAAQRTLLGLGTSDTPTFTALVLAGQSLTGSTSTSVFDASTTWNTTGTPTAWKLNVTDTNSNPASLLFDLQIGAISKFKVVKSGVITLNNITTFTANSADELIISSTSGYQRVKAYSLWHQNMAAGIGDSGQAGGPHVHLSSAGMLGWTSGANINLATYDLFLVRDASGTLAQRNGVNSQTFRLYNTFTNNTNYERGKLAWEIDGVNPVLRIGTEKGSGGGTARALQFQTDGLTRLTIATTGTITTQGAIYVGSTANYIINASSDGAANESVFGSIEGYGPVSGSRTIFQANNVFIPTGGTATYTGLSVTPTIFQTGGSGITRGIHIAPNLIVAADWRSIETTNNTGWAIYAAGTADSYFGGRIGIGNAAPSYALDISGTTPAIRVNNASGNQRILVGSDNSGSFVGTFSNNDLRFFTNSAEVARITAAGNVGIGTTNPTSRLTVRGGNITIGITDTQVVQLGADGSNVGYVGTTTNHPFIIRTNGSNNRIWVSEAGDVGINNTAPSQKLHVTGSIRVTGAYYDSTNSAGTSGQVLKSTATGTDWVDPYDLVGVNADFVKTVPGNRFVENLQTGVLYGGVITVNALDNTKVDISAGAGIIVSMGASTTAMPVPTVTTVTWTAKTAVTLTYLATKEVTWLSINSSGNVVQSTSEWSESGYQTELPLGVAIHPNNTSVSFTKQATHISYGQASVVDPFVRAFGPLKLSGNTIGAYSTNLQISRSSGTSYSLGANYAIDPNNPNIVFDTDANPVTSVHYYYRDGAGGFNVQVGSLVDPTKLDDNSGTLQNVSGGKYTIQRVFSCPTQPTLIGIYYGTQEYNSIEEAEANIAYETFSESDLTSNQGVFCGYLIVKGNTTNLSVAADAKFVQAGLFRSISAVTAGGQAITALDDLTDVVITSPVQGNFLRYNAATSSWVNGTGVDGTGTANYVPKWSDSDTLTNSLIFDNGTNVGIGSNNPLSKLEVRGSGTSTGVTLTLANGGNISVLDDPLGIIDFYSNDASTSADGVRASLAVRNEYNGNWDGNSTRENTYFAISLAQSRTVSEKIRITSSGNLIVGATTSAEKLRVAGGNILLDANYGIRCSDNFRLYDTNSSIDRFLFSTSNSYNTRSGGSHLFNINGSQVAVINSSGNLGVGVGSPSATIDIKGATGSGFSLLLRSGESSSGTGAVQIGFGWNNSTEYRHSIRTRHNSSAAANNAIDFWLWQQGVDSSTTLGSLRVMTIDGANNGSVGIGTSSPNQKLTIDGNINFVSGGNYITWRNGDIRLIRTQNGSGYEFGVETYDGTAIAERIRVDKNGNFGILSSRKFGSGNGYVGDTASASSATLELYNTATGKTTLNNQTYTIGLQTAGIDRITILNNGNVGIGVTTPSYPLDVRQTNRYDAMIHFSGGAVPADSGGYLWSYDADMAVLSAGSVYLSSGNLTAKATTASDLYMYQGRLSFRSDTGLTIGNSFTPTTRFTVGSNGDTGIGASWSKGERCYVAGGALVLDNNQSIKFVDNANNNRRVILVSAANDCHFGPVDAGWGGTTYIHSGGSIVFSVNRLTSALNSVYFMNNGRVGIGNSNPAYKLYSEVDSNSPGNDTVALGIRNINIGTSADTRFYIGHDTSAGAAAIIMYANAHSTRANELAIVNAVSDSTSKITFATNNSVERMRITGSGNIGIGTTNPVTRLAIAQDLTYTNGDNGQFRIEGATSANGGVTIGYDTTNNYAWIYSRLLGSGSRALMLQPAGNVGIGISTPSEKLHVDGRVRIATIDNGTGDFSTISATGVITRRTAAQVLGDIGAQPLLTNPVTGTGTTNYVTKWTSGSAVGNSQIFDDGTNVGIGTTSPSSKLHLMVAGGSAGYGNLLQLERSGGWGLGWVDVQYVGSTFETFLCTDLNTNPTAKISCWQDTWDGGNKPGSIRFYTRPSGGSVTERVRITSTGDVGIGVTSTLARLHVKGSGNTSATFGINLEDSAGIHVFRVRDDGAIHVGPTVGATSGAFISASDGADNIGTTVSSGLRYRSALGTAVAGADHFFRNYQGNRQYSSGIGSTMQVAAPFYPTSGTGVWTGIQIDPTINQTGGANGITRGLWVNSNLIAAANYKAIETANGPWHLTDTYAAGSGSLAGSALLINQTWNTTGTPTAIQLNITDTISNPASLLMDLRVGGSSIVSINKDGSYFASNPNHLSTYDCSSGSSTTVSERYFRYGGTNSDLTSVLEVAYLGGTVASPIAPVAGRYINSFSFRTGGTNAALSSAISFAIRHTIGSTIGSTLAEVSTSFMVNSTATGTPFSALDLIGQSGHVRVPNALRIGASGLEAYLTNDAANILAQRNGSFAQEFRLYNIFTDASNYERGFIRWDSSRLQIGTAFLGTGLASRQIQFVTNGSARLVVNATVPEINIGSAGSNAPGIFSFSGSSFTTQDNGRGLTLYTRTNVTANDIGIAITGEGITATSGASNLHLLVHRSFIPTSGTSGFMLAELRATINQTGGATGTSRGLYINPTLTSATDWRAIESLNGPVILTDTYAAGSGSSSGSLLSLSQTWSTTGTPTAVKLNVTDTASNLNSLLLDLQVGAVSMFKVAKSGRTDINGLLSTGGFNIFCGALMATSFIGVDSSGDTKFFRDGSGIFAQRNGLNAQVFRVYNTIDPNNSANYERGKFAWESNVLRIGTEKGGTGVARALEIQTDGTARITVAATGAVTFAGAVNISSSTQMTYDGSSLSTTTATSITTFAAATYGSAEYLVQVRDTVTGQRQISKILIVHDGTTAYSTEYGVVFTGTAALATFTVDISGGNVRLLAAGATANSTEYKILKTTMVV